MGNIGISGQAPILQPGTKPGRPSTPAIIPGPTASAPAAAIVSDADKTSRGPRSGMTLPNIADPEPGVGAPPLQGDAAPNEGGKPFNPLEGAANLQNAIEKIVEERVRSINQLKNLKPDDLAGLQIELLEQERLETLQNGLEVKRDLLMRIVERENNMWR